MKRRSHLFSIRRYQTVWGYIFIAPALLGFIAFYLGPMLFSLIISFFDWDMIQPAQFIGIQNYIDMFTLSNSLVSKSLMVTLYYTLISVPLITIVSLFISMLLNSKIRMMSVYLTIFYIPSIVPAVANAALWMFLCNPMFGLLNTVLKAVGLPPQNWIYDSQSVIPTLALIGLWGAGNTVVIYLAGLQGVPTHLYEAIEIDGGGAFQKFRHVTIPMLSPVIFYNMIMAIINSMQTFTQAYIMTEGGPNNASLFYTLLLYRTAFKDQQMGYASAMAWLFFIVIALLTIIAFKLSNKWVFYGEE